jgi:hypothetical protein
LIDGYVLIHKEAILNKKSEILKIIKSCIFNEHSPKRTWTHCVFLHILYRILVKSIVEAYQKF